MTIELESGAKVFLKRSRTIHLLPEVKKELNKLIKPGQVERAQNNNKNSFILLTHDLNLSHEFLNKELVSYL